MSDDIFPRASFANDESPSFFGGALLPRLMAFAWRTGMVGLGSVAVVLGLLYYKQDSLLYFPEIGDVPRRPSSNPRRYRSPSEHSIPYETHIIPTEDGVSLHSWLLLRSKHSPTLIFFHGNAGNIGLRLPNAAKMWARLDANVLLVEYRGYGDSSNPSKRIDEKGLKMDAEAALRYVAEGEKMKNTIDRTKVFVFGRSLGGAVGVHLAGYAEKNDLPLAGLILENTFMSIPLMVDVLMPWVAPFKKLILRIEWDSIAVAKTLTLPTLYLSGGKDELVPPSHMKELYAASKQASVCARMHVVKDGTHNETWIQGGSLYWDKINAFMKEAMVSLNINSASLIPPRSGGGVSTTETIKGSINATGSDSPPSGISLAVKTGGDIVSDTRLSSGIPVVPGSLMGMAKEAVLNNENVKKKKN